jgi:phosphoribosylamine-glycine ligase
MPSFSTAAAVTSRTLASARPGAARSTSMASASFFLASAVLLAASSSAWAAAGYPEDPRKGDAISGLPQDAADAMVFHAGTQLQDGVPVTSGGRVLCVTVLADSVKQAQQKVYDVARGIHFDGAQYRRDIGFRAVKN